MANMSWTSSLLPRGTCDLSSGQVWELTSAHVLQGPDSEHPDTWSTKFFVYAGISIALIITAGLMAGLTMVRKLYLRTPPTPLAMSIGYRNIAGFGEPGPDLRSDHGTLWDGRPEKAGEARVMVREPASFDLGDVVAW